MNIKKFAAAFIAVVTVMTNAFADNVTILINNNPLDFPVEPFITEGTTFVPMRAIFEALGAEVNWNGKTRTVTSSKNGTSISVTIGSRTVYKNGAAQTLLAPPVIVNDYTMVPLRFVSESFGCEVDWNGKTRTVTINTKALLENSVIGFIGDSICSGSNFEGGYARIVSEITGATAVNEAQGGSAITRGIPWDDSKLTRPVVTDMLNLLPDNLDYVIMQGGLNDYWAHVALGSEDSLDELTYAGSLNALFKKAREDYPYSKLGFIISHNAFTYDAEEYFEPFYEMTKKVCEKNNIPYLDLYALNNKTVGVNVKDEAMRRTYFETASRPNGDGVHPNEAGYREIYAKPISEWLKKL